MKIIINSYNTISAGTSNITKFILKSLTDTPLFNKKIYFIIPDLDIFKEFKSTKNLKIIKIPVFKSFFHYLFRGIYDFIILPLFTLILNAKAVLILANYSPMPLKGKKIVFMRHPYLIDNIAGQNNCLPFQLIEFLRKLSFKITLNTTDKVVVQSQYMKEQFLLQYSTKSDIHILPNPISNLMAYEKNGKKIYNTSITRDILYISRYYPHKEHFFLLELVEKYQGEFRNKGIKFYITVDPDKTDYKKDARLFLRRVADKKVNDLIVNIGEVLNEDLSFYYKNASCLFFPSNIETFGNPLIEAMAFGLPIIIPDLNYAKQICGEAALYYKYDSIDDAFEKLFGLLEDKERYNKMSEKSRDRLGKFPLPEQWIHYVLRLAGN